LLTAGDKLQQQFARNSTGDLGSECGAPAREGHGTFYTGEFSFGFIHTTAS